MIHTRHDKESMRVLLRQRTRYGQDADNTEPQVLGYFSDPYRAEKLAVWMERRWGVDRGRDGTTKRQGGFGWRFYTIPAVLRLGTSS